jgi:hypothetical protein
MKDIKDQYSLIKENKDRKDLIRRSIRDQNMIPTLQTLSEKIRKGSKRETENINEIFRDKDIKEDIKNYVQVIKETDDWNLISKALNAIVTKVLDLIAQETYDIYLDIENNMTEILIIIDNLVKYVKLDERIENDFKQFPIYSQHKKDILKCMSIFFLISAIFFYSYFYIPSKIFPNYKILIFIWIIIFIILLILFFYYYRRFNYYRKDFESICDRIDQETSGLKVVS